MIAVISELKSIQFETTGNGNRNLLKIKREVGDWLHAPKSIFPIETEYFQYINYIIHDLHLRSCNCLKWRRYKDFDWHVRMLRFNFDKLLWPGPGHDVHNELWIICDDDVNYSGAYLHHPGTGCLSWSHRRCKCCFSWF